MGKDPAPGAALRVVRGRGGMPGVGVPILVFLGAIGPDLGYSTGLTTRSAFFPTRQERATRGKSRWADLLHYNKSGVFLIELLRRGSQATAPALRHKALAYALGHATHIAGDSIVHPLTNTFAGAYHHQSNPNASNGLGIHFYVEFCQDLATDIQYFHAAPHSLAPRPWLRYLAGARDELTRQHDGMSLLDLLKETARSVYHLNPTEFDEFGRQLLSGLAGMRALSRWLSFYPIVNPVLHLSPRLATYFTQQDAPTAGTANGRTHVATFAQAVDFATRVSDRYCSLICAYFADLTAGAAPTCDSYVRLRHDLRDWNLDTGYAMTTTGTDESGNPINGQPPTLTLRHTWRHFLPLLGNERENSSTSDL